MDLRFEIFMAALGGSLGGGIIILFSEWLRWFLDRPLLKVSMTFSFIHNHPMFNKDRYISLEASNPHSKPITVSMFGFNYKSNAGRLQVMFDGRLQFPYEIKAGKSITQLTTEAELFKALHDINMTPSDLKSVWFESSTGKVFKGKIPKVSMSALEKSFQEST